MAVRPTVCQAPLPKVGGRDQPGICGNPLVVKETGRVRRYCSGTCQQRAKRRGYKTRAQSMVHADIKPRGPPPDVHAVLQKVLEELGKREERKDIKELVDALERLTEAQEQTAQQQAPKEDKTKIDTPERRRHARAFAAWLAGRPDAEAASEFE